VAIGGRRNTSKELCQRVARRAPIHRRIDLNCRAGKHQQGGANALTVGEPRVRSTSGFGRAAQGQRMRWSSCGTTTCAGDRPGNSARSEKSGCSGPGGSAHPPLSRKGRLGLGSLPWPAYRPGSFGPLENGVDANQDSWDPMGPASGPSVNQVRRFPHLSARFRYSCLGNGRASPVAARLFLFEFLHRLPLEKTSPPAILSLFPRSFLGINLPFYDHHRSAAPPAASAWSSGSLTWVTIHNNRLYVRFGSVC